MTHFLCFPLTTTHSQPQLRQTLHHFKNDPSTSKIPSDAYRPLQTLHIPIRLLSLPTADRVKAACHHLQTLNINSMLRNIPRMIPDRINRVRQTQQETLSICPESSSSDLSTESVSPSLTVTLSGVDSFKPLPGKGSLHWRLQASCTDTTSRINPFLDEIKQSLDLAGFQIPKLRLPQPETIVLLSTMSSRPHEFIPDSKQPGKYRRVLPPLFETGDIIQKFKNFVFAEDIRLERLSLCELGLQKQIERFGAEAQLSEVCSVPLP